MFAFIFKVVTKLRNQNLISLYCSTVYAHNALKCPHVCIRFQMALEPSNYLAVVVKRIVHLVVFWYQHAHMVFMKQIFTFSFGFTTLHNFDYSATKYQEMSNQVCNKYSLFNQSCYAIQVLLIHLCYIRVSSNVQGIVLELTYVD